MKVKVTKVVEKITHESSGDQTTYKHKIAPVEEDEDEEPELMGNAGMIKANEVLYKPGDIIEIELKEMQDTLEE